MDTQHSHLQQSWKLSNYQVSKKHKLFRTKLQHPQTRQTILSDGMLLLAPITLYGKVGWVTDICRPGGRGRRFSRKSDIKPKPKKEFIRKKLAGFYSTYTGRRATRQKSKEEWRPTLANRFRRSCNTCPHPFLFFCNRRQSQSHAETPSREWKH